MLTIHTSMRWIQQHLRYLAYMESHGHEGQPPLSKPLPQGPSGQNSALKGAEGSGFAQTGNVAASR